MAIMVSNKHMYVQFIDDMEQSTLAAVSTLNNGGAGATVPKAKVLGEQAAEAAKAVGIGTVVVDRGGFAYHGRVRALVEAASEGGLEIGIKKVTDTVQESGE
jgi:large subunit ribosomal protein L18